RNILIQNIDNLRQSFKYAKVKYNFEIIAITVLENHCHLIISSNNSKEIPQIIKNVKFNFSKNIDKSFCDKNLSFSAIKRGEKGIWQRRYYDHIIRNEEDLYKHIDYIHYNSIKHYNIPPKNWKFSSFHKFVKNGYYDINWCNADNKYNICDLCFE
ncbi:MAG: transposase, partial [Candidatus Gastranaerophilales bacterium]|nr:transposase [Candidatus Gastranaerophilales bacterium]